MVASDGNFRIPDWLDSLIIDINNLKKDTDHSERDHESLIEKFFISLGYTSVVDIKYQKGRIDISIKVDQQPIIVVEVKRKWRLSTNVNKALRQAYDYASEIGVRFVIVTNGDFYSLFDRNDGLSYDSNHLRSFTLSNIKKGDLEFIDKLRKVNFTEIVGLSPSEIATIMPKSEKHDPSPAQQRSESQIDNERTGIMSSTEMLDEDMLLERIKDNEGAIFYSAQKENEYRLLKVNVNKRNVLVEVSGSARSVPHKNIYKFYTFVKSKDYYTKSRRDELIAFGWKPYAIPRMFALLDYVIPEELRAFSKEKGEVIVGEGLCGICTIERYNRKMSLS